MRILIKQFVETRRSRQIEISAWLEFIVTGSGLLAGTTSTKFPERRKGVEEVRWTSILSMGSTLEILLPPEHQVSMIFKIFLQ